MFSGVFIFYQWQNNLNLFLLIQQNIIVFLIMNRKSGVNFDQLLNKQWNIITRTEYTELQLAFRKTQQRNGGGISFYDFINIIRNLGIPVTEERKDKINKDFSIKRTRILDFNLLLTTAATLKKQRDTQGGQIIKQSQYLDSFVALGGCADKSGVVNKNNLMNIIKQQFQLLLDLENMIEGLQVENFDYQTFCSIFQQDKQLNDGKLASVTSRTLKTEQSTRSLIIEDRDFQKFMSQYENEEP